MTDKLLWRQRYDRCWLYTGPGSRLCRQATSSEARVESNVLKALFEGTQEPEGCSAIQDSVVEGDLQVHHTADRYRIVHDHRSPNYSFGREYGRLRVVYD